jgi:hypothetical protein
LGANVQLGWQFPLMLDEKTLLYQYRAACDDTRRRSVILLGRNGFCRRSCGYRKCHFGSRTPVLRARPSAPRVISSRERLFEILKAAGSVCSLPVSVHPARLPAPQCACRLANISAWAVAGSHRGGYGTHSMSANVGKHTRTWQTYPAPGQGEWPWVPPFISRRGRVILFPIPRVHDTICSTRQVAGRSNQSRTGW